MSYAGLDGLYCGVDSGSGREKFRVGVHAFYYSQLTHEKPEVWYSSNTDFGIFGSLYLYGKLYEDIVATVQISTFDEGVSSTKGYQARGKVQGMPYIEKCALGGTGALHQGENSGGSACAEGGGVRSGLNACFPSSLSQKF